MTLDFYSQNGAVKSFIQWIVPKINVPGNFVHHYKTYKTGMDWQCDSIFSAYENYTWNGKTFQETSILLNEYSRQLKTSIAAENDEACVTACLQILQWGGVLNGNKEKIYALHKQYGLSAYLTVCTQKLAPATISLAQIPENVVMNSGFTKIYSLLLDDFVIYDGRVGAALGLLVRQFCEATEYKSIPDSLLFAYGDARPTKADTGEQNRRNPGEEGFKFPRLSSDSCKHIFHNTRANWLLKLILKNIPSEFTRLDASIQMRALESALFMIGYDISRKAHN